MERYLLRGTVHLDCAALGRCSSRKVSRVQRNATAHAYILNSSALVSSTLTSSEFWHGYVDGTLSPKNYDKTLKQWTNMFGVGTTPTSSKKDITERNYRADDFGSSVEGIAFLRI
jgi:hypothetical protein